ncbi:uncharacterized mitochondrial protein AtMg00810-like [Miscanthus floridulus]|uniref:uncharacterized mitochondrial protein AtMg00810-like n=1 Tax=Miscanthus floridulus TaxID=154761 RepID=UPI0034574395
MVTHMEELLKLTKTSTVVKVDTILYQSIAGGLRYLVHTRSDIAFVVDYVDRFMEDPKEDYWAVVNRLLCYVKGTVDQKIIFPKIGGSRLQLTVFSVQTWRGTSTDDGAPLACSSFSGRPQFYGRR